MLMTNGVSYDFSSFISRIQKHMPFSRHIIKPNTIFVQKGDIIKRVYLLCSGDMISYNEFENGNIIFVEEMKCESFIGDIETLCGVQEYVCSVSAKTECFLVSISLEDFIHWFETDDYFARHMARRVSMRNCHQASQIGSHKYYNSSYRIATYLLKLAFPQLKMKKDAMLKLTRIELAQTLGLSERTVNRVVKKLVDAKIIYTKRYGNIFVPYEKYSELMQWIDKQY